MSQNPIQIMLLRFLADLVAKQHRQQSSVYLVPVRAVCRGLKDIYVRQYIVKWQRQEGRLVVCRARPQGRREKLRSKVCLTTGASLLAREPTISGYCRLLLLSLSLSSSLNPSFASFGQAPFLPRRVGGGGGGGIGGGGTCAMDGGGGGVGEVSASLRSKLFL